MINNKKEEEAPHRARWAAALISPAASFQSPFLQTKLSWDQPKLVPRRVSVRVSVSGCVLFVAQQLQLVLVFSEQSLESQVFTNHGQNLPQQLPLP